MNIIITGEIAKVSTRADFSLSIHFSTQEMDAVEKGRLLSLQGRFLKAFLTDENIISDEIIKSVNEAEISDDRKKKTPSQRLRAVLFRIWEKDKGETDFNDFYKEKMEEMIAHYHKKLG